MIRRPRKLAVFSDSSGDEDMTHWSDTRNTRNHTLDRASHQTMNSVSSSALSTRKKRNNLPISSSDDSSSSEFENTLQKPKRGSLRPLSDYDSGENSVEGSSGMSTRSISGRDIQDGTCVNSHQSTDEHSDSSSDFNVIRSGRKRHFNIVSSSDSSDSGIPVTFRRRSKRMRLESTSSDSSIEHPNNRSSSVTNQRVRLGTSRRPTATAALTSNGVRQENVAGRRYTSQNRNNTHNNNRSRNNNSHAATTGSEGSVNTNIARSNVLVSNRQSNLRSTNNFTVRENSSNHSISQNQRTIITRSRSNNRTSRINNPRSLNNALIRPSRNHQARSSHRVNHWNVTDSNPGIRTRSQINLFPNDNFDTSSNDSGYFISPSVIVRNNLFPMSSSSSSSPSSTSSDLTSSEDEIIAVRNRITRNRHFRPVIESDEESDTNNVSMYEPEPEHINRNSASTNNVSRPVENVENKSNGKEKEHSSDSEGEIDKCPICLAGFKTQEIGTPKVCDHSFCLVCLQEWAKNNNTCPVDRKLFNAIIVRSEVQGQPLREIVVETPAPPGQFIETDGFWTSVAMHIGFSSEGDDSSLSSLISDGDGPEETCCVCRLSNRSDYMIVCDYCYNVFHLDCVDPPLQYVPAGEWNCPQCLDVEMQSYSDSSSDSDYVV